MEEFSVECVGQNCPDKKNYVVIIGEEFGSTTPSTWDSCYKIIESNIKQLDRDKDLTSIKKTLQEKGYVKLHDKQYAIGTILDKT
mgnify:CR=1 FL=1